MATSATDNMVSQPPQARLLCLPLELRTQIYQYALFQPVLHCSSTLIYGYLMRRLPPFLPLACKQIYGEIRDDAWHLLLSLNFVVFTGTGDVRRIITLADQRVLCRVSSAGVSDTVLHTTLSNQSIKLNHHGLTHLRGLQNLQELHLPIDSMDAIPGERPYIWTHIAVATRDARYAVVMAEVLRALPDLAKPRRLEISGHVSLKTQSYFSALFHGRHENIYVQVIHRRSTAGEA